jgi:phosphoribosylamine--glycine ligase
VRVEEKIVGVEFTIQAISDGSTVVFPPATYDYPYRYDGDEGPGTGGMGSLSMPGLTLPFMTPAHYEQACSIIERIIALLTRQGRHFSGVMNSGFFATADGVKVIEFNARFGDPE